MLNNSQWLICHKVKLATLVECDPKAPFSIATTLRVKKGGTPFLGMIHFTLYTYLKMLSVKQGGNLLSFLLRCGTRPYERGTQ